MKKYRNMTPDQAMKAVTIEIIERAIKLGKKKNRDIFVSKTSGGKGTSVYELNPKTAEGKENLEKFLTQLI